MAKVKKKEKKEKKVVKTTKSSWLDDKKKTPIIEEKAKKLKSFIKTMEDGVVEESEIEEQEDRLAGLMKEVEPQLDSKLHAKVTELLCELTAYDIMRFLFTMQQNRPVSKFKG